jgi:tetratricopeptide (TPR) repeat protein
MRFLLFHPHKPLRSHLALLLIGFALPAASWAQQDISDRLWQGTEQRARQLQQEAAPSDADERRTNAGLTELSQDPYDRLQTLTLGILDAVNQRDWFGADRLLRQYAQVPRHDPALFDFVKASRLAADERYTEAVETYQNVLRTNPGFLRGLLDLGQILYLDGRLKEADTTFRQLRSQSLPNEIQQFINEYIGAIERRQQWQFSLSADWVHEDNLNQASTYVDACALVLAGSCFSNKPGEKISDSGTYFEASANKLWALSGHHGLLFRSINYGNQYYHEDDYNNLVSINSLGYQYSSARNQFQLLPTFEYDNEGGHRAYHSFGLRASFSRQLTPRAQLEASLEYKDRHFSDRFNFLQGNYRSASLFGTYMLQPSMQLYGMLTWRDSDAESKTLAYHENIARVGIYKVFGDQLTVNLAYGHRRKHAEAANFLFNGRHQKDRENTIYLGITVPRLAWQGLTPSFSYEYRNNHSNIPHAYSYEKNRVTLGLRKIF